MDNPNAHDVQPTAADFDASDAFEMERLIGLIRAGADDAIAAALAGIPPNALQQMCAADESLLREMRKAGAESVLLHLRNIHDAAKDPRNWRLSVWWLERRARMSEGETGGFKVVAFFRFWWDVQRAIQEIVTSPEERAELLQAVLDAKQINGLN